VIQQEDCEIEPTGCCAFAQLRADEGTSLENLQQLLKDHAWYVQNFNKVGSPLSPYHQIGAPQVWAITTPSERELARKLEFLGFEFIREMERRRGYPKGKIKLWIKTFSKEEE
jgi:hypothetical protein